MAVADQVKKIIVEQLGVDEEEVTPDASFVDDLGADSLDTVELVMAFEEEFGIEIPDEDAEKITRVKEAIEYIEATRRRSSGGRRRFDQASGRHRRRPGFLGRHRDRRPTGTRSSRARAASVRSRHFDADGVLSARIAGEVKGFDPLEFIEKKDVKKMDVFIQFAIAAAQFAVRRRAPGRSRRDIADARRRVHRVGHRRVRHHRARAQANC